MKLRNLEQFEQYWEIYQRFIVSVLLVKYELPNLEKLCSKAYRDMIISGKDISWYSIFDWLNFKWYKICIYDGWLFHKVWLRNFNKNKKAETIFSAFKQWLTLYLISKILYTDNGGEFRNKVMRFYFF